MIHLRLILATLLAAIVRTVGRPVALGLDQLESRLDRRFRRVRYLMGEEGPLVREDRPAIPEPADIPVPPHARSVWRRVSETTDIDLGALPALPPHDEQDPVIEEPGELLEEISGPTQAPKQVRARRVNRFKAPAQPLTGQMIFRIPPRHRLRHRQSGARFTRRRRSGTCPGQSG